MEQEIKDIEVKYEIVDNVEALLEENIVKQEKDIPEYVNVNVFSNVKAETEASENVPEIFQCCHCPNKYKKIAYLTIHEALHDPQRFCPICYEVFTCKKKLGHHLNQHIKDQMKEDKKLAYSCSYCEKSFDTKKKITLHERVHTNERPHKCEICGEGFKQSGTLKDHYVTHTKEKRFLCEICNGGFTTSSSLKRHKRKMHDKGKTINCKYCDDKFLNMAAFRTHRNNAHPNVGYKRTCPLCFEIFRTRCTYKKHKAYHDDHDQVPNDKELFIKYYNCMLCGEKNLSLNLYLEHRRIHLNYTEKELEEAKKNNVYECKSCALQFLSKSTLFKHMDVHMEKNIKCDFCQLFYTYHGLNTHMKTSHQCRICCKVISKRSNLYFHYQKHHPAARKPYFCSICGRQYVARNQLNLHYKLIHERHPVKNFKCSMCGKRFLTKMMMTSHMSFIHSLVQSRKIKYKCSLCEFVCATKKEIKTHNLIHKKSTIEAKCGEKSSTVAPKKRFQCKLCKKIFKSRKNCKIHLTFKACRNFLEKKRRMEAANNNRCLVCLQKFATVGILQRHMRIHSSFEFTCRFCQREYKMVGMLRRHMQSHHPGESMFRCEPCNEEFDKIHEYSKHINEHKIKLEPPGQIDSLAVNVSDDKCTFALDEPDVFKQEPEDFSVEYVNCE